MKQTCFLAALLACFMLFTSTGFGAKQRKFIIKNHAVVDAYCAYAYVGFTTENLEYHIEGWVRVPSGRAETIEYASKYQDLYICLLLAIGFTLKLFMEKKMLKKNWFFCISILSIVLFIGCGGSIVPLSVGHHQPGPPPQRPFWQSCLPGCLFPSPAPSPALPFTPIGSWEMVSIDGKSVKDYFALYEGNLAHIETKILQNDFVFTKGEEWFWTLKLDIRANLGVGLNLITEMTVAALGTYSGSYTPSGGSMTIIQKEFNIRFIPEDFWESAGVSEAAFKQSITRDWLSGEVQNWNAQFSGNRLTLTGDNGMKQVLKRQ